MQAQRIKVLLNKVRLSFNGHSQHKKTKSQKLNQLILTEKGTPLKPFKIKINKETISSNKILSSNFTTLNRPQTAIKTDVITKMPSHNSNLCKGMNDKFLFMRKQNHLNTCFNIRKRKLKQMTKVNQQIYKRLNTQKSFYSNSDLNKSYQSTKSIQSRLSQSKLSNRMNLSKNSSKKSLHSQKSLKRMQKDKKKEQKIDIKTNDINKMNAKEVNSFRCLFIKDLNSKTDIQKSKKYESNQQIPKYNGKKYDYGLKNMNNRWIHTRKSEMSNKVSSNEGGLLHRIQENMYQNKENIKRSSLYMGNRKLFNM